VRTHFDACRPDDDESYELRRELMRRSIATLFAFANAAALMSGCSGAGPMAAPVDPAMARSALATVMESWKKGDKPESLQSGSPAIVVQDLDWSRGAVLIAFEISGEGKNDDANLRVPVALTLKQPDGKTVKRQATYLVGTSPSVTVFRELP
jgi:hypothetical protein